MGSYKSKIEEVDVEKATDFLIWDNFPLYEIYIVSSIEEGPRYPPPSTPIPIMGARRGARRWS